MPLPPLLPMVSVVTGLHQVYEASKTKGIHTNGFLGHLRWCNLSPLFISLMSSNNVSHFYDKGFIFQPQSITPANDKYVVVAGYCQWQLLWLIYQLCDTTVSIWQVQYLWNLIIHQQCSYLCLRSTKTSCTDRGHTSNMPSSFCRCSPHSTSRPQGHEMLMHILIIPHICEMLKASSVIILIFCFFIWSTLD